ncbi:hypothetical protein Kim5_CH00759 [Rhizobium sp. Kim5]|uniref:hypothetical protein n=1 Tax=Rhizobium sp. Kim5 TaxID=2020311 RepID=UPI00019047F7|nr:hypothetical protein [Rhizobium sp. Kim5]ARQ56867.1 hypothetical protein Kim5_CH00759 [Rhizobium sp. Kim5]
MIDSLKIGLVVFGITLIGLGYWHYTSVVDDLAAARAENASLELKLATVADIANRNAEAVARADADRRAAIETLEFFQLEVETNTKTSRLAESEIDTAAAADDGDVAPLMEALRKSRFGGRP